MYEQTKIIGDILPVIVEIRGEIINVIYTVISGGACELYDRSARG